MKTSKNEINPMPKFFDRYIVQVNEEDIFEGFANSLSALNQLDLEVYTKIADKKYQPEKWSVKDILQHIIDNERIQSYRAMRISRKDKTSLPGYDEELLGKNARASKRPIEEILEELKTVRTTTIQLYKSFDEEAMFETGISFEQVISPLALGYVMIGHQLHHLRVIEEKYFPLINH